LIGHVRSLETAKTEMEQKQGIEDLKMANAGTMTIT
jgi:hypothetical protein